MTVLLGLAGCHREVTTEFPPGLEPLEDNEAPWPKGSSDDPYPEEIEFVTGSTDDYDWAHGRAYVHASIADTIDVLRIPEVNVDRREVDEWSVEWDVEPDYDSSYAIDNLVHDVVDVEFVVTWRHGVTAGTADAPEQGNSRWQKTDGSTFIDIIEGSIVILPKDDDVTGLELVEHLDSLQSDTDTITSYLRDMFASVVATAHGEPLPVYN